MEHKRWIVAVALLALLGVACSGQPRADGDDVSPVGTETGTPDLLGETPDPDVTGSAVSSVGATTPGTGTGGGGGGGGGNVIVKPPSTPGGVPEANLYTGAVNTQGINADRLVLCEHAGITLAGAFGNDAAHFDTYWRMVNENGGIHGRDVDLVLEDDGYNANQASTAFDACNSANPFLIIGGIGFDQIPSVRQKAEDNKELYIYGTATQAGTANARYSFAAGPTVEYMGRRFAEATAKYNKGKRVGVLTVASPGWKPGAEAFAKRLGELGMSVAVTREIANNNDVLTNHVAAFDGAVDVVFLNVNALAFTRFITEADTQDFHPRIIGWSFNLVPETGEGKVGEAMQRFPLIQGLSVSPVHDPAVSYPWKDEYQKMKAAYVKYYGNDEPNDIDWIQWLGMKFFHQLLLDCGKSCTRNKLAGLLLTGYAKTVSPNCKTDFARGKGRFGGWYANYWQAVDRGNTSVWKQIETCKDRF